jgi:hypothetical protein
MSVFDLRQWLTDADSPGKLEHVRRADAVLETGAPSQLNYRLHRPRALTQAAPDLPRPADQEHAP